MKLQLLIAVLLPLAAANAELPPSAYRSHQEAAPEALQIRVEHISRTENKFPQHREITHTVTAKVQEVERSASDVKPGATIQIVYTQRRYDQPRVGPSEVPSLKEGQVYPAFLRAIENGKTYSPAAGGYTFEKVN